MKPAPFFSIILPVYNAAPYIAGAIASLLRQDHTAFEIIAIDDGSTDGSLRILEAQADADPRIRVVSRRHRGLVATLNEGLNLARADLVARMDADDICYPWRLSSQADAFAADPALALCGSTNDEIVGKRILPADTRQSFDGHDLRILSLFFTLFTHSSAVFNRRVIPEEELSYDSRYPYTEDFELFGRITARYRARRIERSLLATRVLPGSFSGRHKLEQQKFHFMIIAHNLARELGVETESLGETGSAACEGRLSPSLVVRVAALFAELEATVGCASPASAPSYAMGIGNLFQDLCLAIRTQDPALLRLFVDRTEKWDWLRRRDRLWLAAYGHSAVLGSAVRRAVALADAGARHLQTVPPASVLTDLSIS